MVRRLESRGPSEARIGLQHGEIEWSVLLAEPASLTLLVITREEGGKGFVGSFVG